MNCKAKDAEETARVRRVLETHYGETWDTDQLQKDFTVEGFQAPYVVVRRKVDGARGTLQFQHMPRFYWGFVEDRG